mmetsp:Transcript_3251/g.4667  ORF Transcript_3251/g.4667 Transcript_3251/m.4667 type:complete len:189 (-) Transcript_3251:601-1167(-)
MPQTAHHTHHVPALGHTHTHKLTKARRLNSSPAVKRCQRDSAAPHYRAVRGTDGNVGSLCDSPVHGGEQQPSEPFPRESAVAGAFVVAAVLTLSPRKLPGCREPQRAVATRPCASRPGLSARICEFSLFEAERFGPLDSASCPECTIFSHRARSWGLSKVSLWNVTLPGWYGKSVRESSPWPNLSPPV